MTERSAVSGSIIAAGDFLCMNRLPEHSVKQE